MNLKIGIIIPSYNDARIIHAIKSVIKNDASCITKIYVIDGLSDQDIIDKITECLRPDDFIISEQDRGVFDALNKGIELVSESIIGWLGSDDLYPQRDGFFEEIASIFESSELLDAIVYDCQHTRANRNTRITKAVGSKEMINGRHNGHYATFINKRSIGERRFEIDKLYSDILFFFDLVYQDGLNFLPVNKIGVLQEEGGISTSSNSFILRNNLQVFWSIRSRIGFTKALVFIFRKIFFKLPIYFKFLSLKNYFIAMIKANEYFESFLRWNFLFKFLGQHEIEAEIVSKLPGNRHIAIDIGAAEGFYSYVFSKHFKQVRSFEPHPSQFKRLDSFAPTNVETCMKAVSSREGSLDFFIPRINDQLVPHEAKIIDPDLEEIFDRKSSGEILKVDSVVLDNFINEADKENINLIKIDVEGHERDALSGMQEIISRAKPIIICEIEARHDPNFMETFNFLINRGYETFITLDGINLKKITPSISYIEVAQSYMRLNLRLYFKKYTNLLPYINNFIFIHKDKL